MSEADDPTPTPPTPPTPPTVVNVEDGEVIERLFGDHWGGVFKSLTPSMRPRGGSLGINHMTLPPRRATLPFHAHEREDEAFFILSGRGVLRYGDEPLRELRVGDCVSCPAGTHVAHQLANPFDEDLVYLAVGNHDPCEVCSYPDTGKVLIRSLGHIGLIQERGYFEGEPDEPKILTMIADSAASSAKTGQPPS